MLKRLPCLAAMVVAASARARGSDCVSDSNEGAEQRSGRHLLEARDSYSRCTTQPTCPAIVKAECTDALEQLHAAIPTILISVVDEQLHDVTGAKVTLDGQPVVLDGAPLELDPGPHRIVAEGNGSSAELELIALESDHNRKLALTIKAPTVAPEPSAAKSQGTEVSWPARRQEANHTAAYALLGAGGLALGSFAFFAISGKSGMSKLESCKPHCQAGDVRAVDTKYLAADISLGVGVVALAAATYAYLTASPPPEMKPVRDALVLEADSHGAFIGWSFRR